MKTAVNVKHSAFTRRMSPVRIRLSPLFFLHSEALERSIGAFIGCENHGEKGHNSDEKLHNSDEPDLSWQQGNDLRPEDETEGGSEIYCFADEGGNVHSREFLERELIPDESTSKISKERESNKKLKKLKPGAIDIITSTHQTNGLFWDCSRIAECGELQKLYYRRFLFFLPVVQW